MTERDPPILESPDPPEAPESASRITVVGIGASAGGFSALREFFAAVPPESGLAFVVVVHLAAEHESHLAEILQRHAPLPIEQVTRTTPLLPDHVYVIPPACNLSAIDTHLRLSDLEEERGDRAPIDHFFRTLAETHGGRAVGVILSGAGSDGAQGVRRIRERGGLVIAQSPREAEYDGMPRSAIATGIVDLVLPLAAMPGHIVEFARTRPRVALPEDEQEAEGEQGELLQKVLALLQVRTGHDLSRFQRSAVARRLRRRMQIRRVERLADYLELLRENGREAAALAEDFLINDTRFFGEPEVFRKLEAEVIPRLFERKGPDDHLRLWSIGCATGEEAFSLAMLLVEEAERREAPPELQLFASDLHPHSLKHAREALYPETIAADIPPERLERFFLKETGGYRIRPELRDLVIFASHDLLRDPPFSRLDLVTCRNVLTYLRRQVQEEVVELLHYALGEEGYLLLSTAETLHASDLFRVESREHHLYRRRSVGPDERRLVPLPPALKRPPRAGWEPTPPAPAAVSFGALHQRMIAHHAPPSLLVSEEHEILHLSEDAGRYLQHAGGMPSSNLFRMVREELRLELRAALHLARERRTATRSPPIPIRMAGEPRQVVLHVSPAAEPGLEGFALVTFEEVEQPYSAPEAEARTEGAAAHEQQAELEMTRSRLQTIVEQHTTSQEEMRASNEELQSSNEELRSALEELAASKEELQSANEELQTLNEENRSQVEELRKLSSDLQNLLRSTEIATLFLDRSLRIQRFTPRVGELFNVRHTDRGRPLSDFTHRLGYAGLLQDAERVLQTLVPVEREVESQNGESRWYLVRVMPYRTADDRIEGVVITLVDITAPKRSEAELRESEAKLRESEAQHRLIVESAEDYAILTMDPEGRIASWSPGAQAVYGWPPEEILGQPAAVLFVPEDQASGAPEEERATARATGAAPDVRWHLRKDGTRVFIDGVTRALSDASGGVRGFVKIGQDVTQRRQTEEALRESEARLRELSRSLESRVAERTAELARANEALARQVAERRRAEAARTRLLRQLATAEEEERRRLSRELHDQMGQLLTGLILGLRALERGAGAGDPSAQIRDLAQLADRIAREMQNLAVQLRPPALDNLGLKLALESHLEEWSERHGIEADFQSVGLDEERLPAEVESTLYRIVQEGLTNVLRHAGATRVSLLLERRGGSLSVILEDDGQGFDVEDVLSATARAKRLGLRGMRERIALLGGTLDIESSAESGTTVFARVPDPSSLAAAGAEKEGGGGGG